MSIKTDLFAFLVADAGIIAAGADRIYHDQAPLSAALPYVVLAKVSAPREHVTGGTIGPTGLVDARLQLTAWAGGPIDAETIATAIRRALNGKRGVIGGTTIHGTFLENEIDVGAAPRDGSDMPPFGVLQEYRIWHTETL